MGQPDWRVYYGDGSTYDDLDGPPAEAPKRGVQAIVRTHPSVGFLVLEGHDYYWFDRGEWLGGDRFGLFDYLSQSGRKVVLFGRSIRRDEYEAIVQRARDDPDFPEKSATLREER